MHNHNFREAFWVFGVTNKRHLSKRKHKGQIPSIPAYIWRHCVSIKLVQVALWKWCSAEMSAETCFHPSLETIFTLLQIYVRQWSTVGWIVFASFKRYKLWHSQRFEFCAQFYRIWSLETWPGEPVLYENVSHEAVWVGERSFSNNPQ